MHPKLSRTMGDLTSLTFASWTVRLLRRGGTWVAHLLEKGQNIIWKQKRFMNTLLKVCLLSHKSHVQRSGIRLHAVFEGLVFEDQLLPAPWVDSPKIRAPVRLLDPDLGRKRIASQTFKDLAFNINLVSNCSTQIHRALSCIIPESTTPFPTNPLQKNMLVTTLRTRPGCIISQARNASSAASGPE